MKREKKTNTKWDICHLSGSSQLLKSLRFCEIDVYVWFLTVWFFDAENFISENAFLNRNKHIGCFHAVGFMFRSWMTVKLRLFNNFDFFGIVNKLFTGLNL